MAELFQQLGIDWSVVWKQIVVFATLMFVVPVSVAIWMYNDSRSHGDQAAAAWAVAGILCWPITLIVFLIARSQRAR